MLKTGRALLGLLVVLLIAGTAFAGKKQDLEEAQQAYQQSTMAGDVARAKEMAAESYRLGSKVYGRKSPDTAKLAINYAKLLNDAGDTRRARKVLKGKLKVMENQYGKDSIELTSLLFELGRAHYEPENPKEGLGHFQRASVLLEQRDSELYRAKRNFDIMTELLKRGGNADTRSFIEKAHGVYSKRLKPNDFRLGLTSYHMGLWSMLSDKEYAKSVEYFNAALTAFQTDDGKMSDSEEAARTRLVQAYESAGQSKDATQHCLVLGKSQEWVVPAEPLYQRAPDIPKELTKSGFAGKIEMAFTIDAAGFVSNARIVSAKSSDMDNVALDAIQGFRYAPRFVDGQPVSTDDVGYAFNMAKPKRKGRIGRRFSASPQRGFADGGQRDAEPDVGGGQGGGK
jgi:hypothetical protein